MNLKKTNFFIQTSIAWVWFAFFLIHFLLRVVFDTSNAIFDNIVFISSFAVYWLVHGDYLIFKLVLGIILQFVFYWLLMYVPFTIHRKLIKKR